MKNLNQALFLFGLSFIILSCSKVEQVNMNLPDVDDLRPETIQTNLAIINIDVDTTDFNRMFESYAANIVINASIDFYNRDYEPIFVNRGAKIEIKGAGSAGFSIKSLGIIFNTTLNNADTNIIQDFNTHELHSLKSLKTIRLRNSGQDYKETMLKDMAYSQFAIKAGINCELMYGNKAAQVFINNEYYGMLNIRTESNRQGLSELLQQDTSNIVVYKVDHKNQNIEHHEGNINLSPNLEEAIDNANPYELAELIDVASFIDYVIYQDYIGNFDWPGNNIRLHKSGRNKFRFVLYDLDKAAFQTKNPKMPELEYLNFDLAKIYQNFLQIEGFQEQLNARQKLLYSKFKIEDFNEILNELALNIEDELPYQIAKHGQPISLYSWKIALGQVKRNFERRDNSIRKKYGL